MSISLRLHHFFQSLNTAPASKIKAKQQTCVLQRQIDTDVRYRLVDLLDALLQLPSSPLQERITAQALLCLLHQLSHCAKFRPNARGFPQRATEVQPYRDTLTLLLPLFEVAILRSRPDMLVDVSCEKGCEILLAQVHDSEAAKTFENLHGTVIKRQLLSSLEGLLLRHSIVDYTRVLNLGPVLPL